jgi:hypothetical protein
MPTGTIRRRLAIGSVLLPSLISAPGCITYGMWSSVDKKTSHKIEAGLATPVTLALDAAIIGGCIFALAFAHPGPSAMTDTSSPAPIGMAHSSSWSWCH